MKIAILNSLRELTRKIFILIDVVNRFNQIVA